MPSTAFSKLQWVKVADDFEAGFDYVANDGTIFLLKTNRDAPKNKIVKVDVAKPGAEAGGLDLRRERMPCICAAWPVVIC